MRGESGKKKKSSPFSSLPFSPFLSHPYFPGGEQGEDEQEKEKYTFLQVGRRKSESVSFKKKNFKN